MSHLELDPLDWARQQFGTAVLGNSQRTERLVKLAAQVAANPAASLPNQTQTWADLKAAYRLVNAPAVTFAAVATPHWLQTQNTGPGHFLVIGDTTEIDFGVHRQVPGLSAVGNGKGAGFLLHSALIVEAESERILGLAGQTVHYRKPAPRSENAAQRLKRDRESQIWGTVIDLVGPAPAEAQWTHVLDRGADNFEVFCHCQDQHVGWVVRASSLHREITDEAGTSQPLSTWLGRREVAGTFTLNLRARPRQPARTARLVVSYGTVAMPSPKHKSPYLRARQSEPIGQTVVWVREVNPPPGVEPIAWVLYTSLAVASLADAMRIVSYYERRWLIEEWHKALKTGCQAERSQLQSVERLEPLVGLLGVVAVRLLQLKSAARTEPDRAASEFVPRPYLLMMIRLRKWPATMELSVGRFYRELAKLGGFLGRKSDGEPGWITLWRGWEKLHWMVLGAETTAENVPQDREKSG